jgi:pilus assembly protein CpaB
MHSKTVLISLFLLSVVALGAVLWRNANVPTTAAASIQQSQTMIIAAAQPLRTGTLLRAEDIKWLAWNDAVPAGAVPRPSDEQRAAQPNAELLALSSVYGAVLKQRVEPGTPILASMIVKPGDRGFLAAVLLPGYRAVSIGVNPVSGASGLIYPGDHVDLLLTQNFKQGEEPISRRSVSETIVSNIRVLAIDQRLQDASADPKDNQIPIPRTVTVEVLPKQAEMINVAVTLGNLSLSLRSVPLEAEPVVADNSVKETLESTWADDVSPALKPPKQPTIIRKATEVHVFHGGKAENVAN